MNTIKVDDINDLPIIEKMCSLAWRIRENARLATTGKTKVASVVYNYEETKMFSGCNIEHRFRSHDIHAEVNAISSLVAAGVKSFDMILIVAERDKFTPCGSCMDWIMEISGPKCKIMFQGKPNGEICVYTANELMPHYPF